MRGLAPYRGVTSCLLLHVLLCTASAVAAEHGTGFRLPPHGDTFWQMKTEPSVYPKGAFPPVYDWRALGGVTPVKDQGSCGSCWAFATVGVFECAIKIQDGVTVDLSEQNLLGCNDMGWGCSGALWAHDWHKDRPNKCGTVGAVLEADLPYEADDSYCTCGHTPAYVLQDWGWVNGLTPSVEDIKAAIMTYGPVGVSLVSDVLGSGTGVVGD